MDSTTRAEESTAALAAGEGAAEIAVSVRSLSKTYGDGYAVHDLSFEVPRGEIFGFIGPNGAGKTTTLRILATLLEPTAGEVLVEGRCVVNETEEVRRRIGYMPDRFGVYDGVTVEEYLEFFAGAYRLPRGRRAAVIKDVLDLTDLGALRDRMVSSLSMGMKQRLCLAKTLVHDPSLLILDEPASALDARARIEMRVLLKELRRMGKTIIISSHILTELSDLCTSVAIIEKGELVVSGSMDLLQERKWGTDRVKITLHEPRPGVEEALVEIPAVELVSIEENVVVFDYAGAPGEFYKVLKALTDREVPVVSVEHDSRNLENLFLRLTKGDVQ
ncbi:MAG: ABC transporter ATP-binding protein [Planctomycetes bacterium]|nr:ABC transporter ATP-binding protein [Planctomycetota bacterium]